MVLNETQKKWLGVVGGAAFVVAQLSFYFLGIANPTEPTYQPVALIISEECMDYVEQSPIQRIPDDRCLREIKYLKYRITLVLEEVDRVP